MLVKYLTNCFYILIVVVFSSACSEYNKTLKSSDSEKKYSLAVKLYEEEKYYKAFPLLEELVNVYRGTDKAEKVYYYYAYCNYYMGDFEYANYYFKNFTKTFPNSKLAEECFYMSAYTYYLDSPEYSLDQTNTFSAINELQLFVERYPSSEKAKEATGLIDKLYLKLETKSYNICKHYYRTQDYKAAVISMQNALHDYPSTKYAEELSFLIIKSNYLYAINSIEIKKEERLKKASTAYTEFIQKYPKSVYLQEINNIQDHIQKLLTKQNNT